MIWPQTSARHECRGGHLGVALDQRAKRERLVVVAWARRYERGLILKDVFDLVNDGPGPRVLGPIATAAYPYHLGPAVVESGDSFCKQRRELRAHPLVRRSQAEAVPE